MDKDPTRRSWTIKLAAAAAVLALAAYSADRMAGPDPDGCDSRLTNPASLVFCPVIDGGTAMKRMIGDQLSLELKNIP